MQTMFELSDFVIMNNVTNIVRNCVWSMSDGIPWHITY